ncbi:hypothetical protein DL98DRAFT_526007 [Cadophora sp. DSE1049]|nr:hypothetical protein DL98DRAFT_526007 [Cadophora sp. DSE1049]
MSAQHSATSSPTQPTDISYTKDDILELLEEACQFDVQLTLPECYEIGFALDDYHDTTGDPICLSESFALQPYLVELGSLPLEPTFKGSKNNLLFRVTLYTADKYPIVLQGLLVGRLMKYETTRELMATCYVVFLASDHQLYACFSPTVDPYEVGPQRYGDDNYNHDDNEGILDTTNVGAYLEGEAVFGEAVQAVNFGTLDDIIKSPGKCKYTLMDKVTRWECFPYEKCNKDQYFAADTMLAMKTKSSPSRSGKTTTSTTSSGTIGPEFTHPTPPPSPCRSGIQK